MESLEAKSEPSGTPAAIGNRTHSSTNRNRKTFARTNTLFEKMGSGRERILGGSVRRQNGHSTRTVTTLPANDRRKITIQRIQTIPKTAAGQKNQFRKKRHYSENLAMVMPAAITYTKPPNRLSRKKPVG